MTIGNTRRASAGLRMPIFASLIGMAALAVVSPTSWAKADEAPGRGVVVITAEDGQSMELYAKSYALLIGASTYTEWPPLDSVPREIDDVEDALQEQGFVVEKVIDPSAAELKNAFESFIRRHGYDKDNRLVFFFSGHGHTRSTEAYGDKGYIVPVDAPLPRDDEAKFLGLALPMSQIVEWSRRIEAKHALFLFDSCFSGSVFQTRALPEIPPHISAMTRRPVVQFVTAGGAKDEVPAKSVFTPAFVDALRYAKGDLNSDGYVTGVELGLYLRDTVPMYAGQHPQFGKHRDYERSQGDIVFVVGESNASTGGEQQEANKAPDIPAPQSDALTDRVNLISPQNGGDVLFASSDAWVRTVRPDANNPASLGPGEWAVFAFADERSALFDTFRVRVNETSSTNLQEFELLVSNSSPDNENSFKSLGRFKARNFKSMKDPYHNIALPLTRARYLKMRILSSYGHAYAWNHEFQLLGQIDE